MTVAAAEPVLAEAGGGAAVAGAASKAKRKPSKKTTSRPKKSSGGGSLAAFFTGGSRYSEKHYRRLLAAEFVFGVVLLTWEELTNQRPLQVTINGVTHNPPRMKQYAAWCFAFFLLALLTTGGRRMARISSQLGGLMVGAIMLRPVSDGHGGTTFAGSNMLSGLAKLFSSPSSTTGPQTKRSLIQQGLVPSGAQGLASPPTTGPGANQMWIQGSDGLWYPGTGKVGQLPVINPSSFPSFSTTGLESVT